MTRGKDREQAQAVRLSGRMRPGVARRALERYFEQVIAHAQQNPSYVPRSYRSIAAVFGVPDTTVYHIAQRKGFTGLLAEMKEGPKEFEFLRGQDVAWFLGAMVAAGIRHQNHDADRQIGIEFRSKDPHTLEAVRQTGERLFGIPAEELNKYATPRVVFKNHAISDALGDFGYGEKVGTIRHRHSWVLDDQYVARFASGVIDASPEKVFTGKNLRIKLHTEDIQTARFYLDMFIRLGIEGAYLYYADGDKTHLKGVAITNLRDMQRLANQITSVNPDIQIQLNQLKRGEVKRAFTDKPSSIQEVVDEWNNLRQMLGETFSEETVNRLFHQGDTRFPARVYSFYFGKSSEPGELSTFVRARDALMHLVSLSPAEAEKIIAEMSIRRRRLPRADLLAAWKDLVERFGPDVSSHKVTIAYKKGETPYDVGTYAGYFGIPDGGGKRSYPLARERLNELLAQEVAQEENSSEIQIYP